MIFNIELVKKLKAIQYICHKIIYTLYFKFLRKHFKNVVLPFPDSSTSETKPVLDSFKLIVFKTLVFFI